MKPLLVTDEPLCQDGFLACGDGNCVERGLFCNGEKDCADGSDENSCGELFQTTTQQVSCLTEPHKTIHKSLASPTTAAITGL